MASAQSEALPNNRRISLASESPSRIVSSPRPNLASNLFHRFIDSFKRSARAEDVSIEMSLSQGHDHQEENVEKQETGLHRKLKSRHLKMIAMGGSIGTGLFVASGSALATGGPAALVLDFFIVGFMLFNVCMALGELAVTFPVSGSFAVYSSRFLDPAWGFAMGWNYALNSLITMPLELTAAGIIIDYWKTHVHLAVWITVFLLLLFIINLFGVRGYGEVEFFVSTIKVIAIVGFLLLGFVLIFGIDPHRPYIGSQYWRDPGAFANGIKGILSVFVTAGFAFGGTELVGLAAAEAGNPRTSIPRAVKQIFWRIAILYILSLTIMGSLVPYTSPRLLSDSSSANGSASPFVIAIEDAHINVLPSIFNVVILCSVLAVGNSSIYAASRTLCALAGSGQAPRILTYIDRQGRPLSAVGLSFILGLIAYINCANVGAEVFHWLLALSSLSSFFTWASICACHIMFRLAWKAQGHSISELAFTAPLGIWGSVVGLIFNILCLIAQLYIALSPVKRSANVVTFFQAYLAVPVVLLFYVVWKIWKRTPFMRPSTIDLEMGRRLLDTQQLIEEERAERKTWPLWKKMYRLLC